MKHPLALVSRVAAVHALAVCFGVAAVPVETAPPVPAREPSSELQAEIPLVADLWREVSEWRSRGIGQPGSGIPVDMSPVLEAIEAVRLAIESIDPPGTGAPVNLDATNEQLKRLADRLELTLRGPVWLDGAAGEHRAAFLIESPDGEPLPEQPEQPEEPGFDPTTPFALHAKDFVRGYDATPGNQSNAPASSANPDVDLEVTTDEGGGVNLAWWRAGEWIEWNTPPMAAGRWRVRVRVATPASGGIAMVSIDGADKAQINVPNTGAWHTYQEVQADFTVEAGAHTARIMGLKAASNGTVANFSRMHFTWLGASAEVPVPEAGKLVFGHEMMAMPPSGGATTVASITERLRRAREYGIDVVELFHPEAFPATAAQYYTAAEQLGGIRLCLSFGYIGSALEAQARQLIDRHRDSPAQHVVDGEPYVTAYHASSVLGTIASDCHYVPHIFARGPDGGVIEQATVVGLERVLDNYPGLDGLASFYPLDDWRRIHQNYFAALEGRGLEFRMSISARHEPVGHKGNWRVYEGRGFQGITEQLKFALENRSKIKAITLVTLNDYSEGTDLLGDAKAEQNLVVPDHWNSSDWPAMLARDGTLDFAQRYLIAWKTGTLAPVTGLGVWICYRLQGRTVPPGVAPNGKPGEWQKLQDAIYVAVRSPSPVSITVNGQTLQAAAGETLLEFTHTPGPVVVSWPGGSRTLPAIVETAVPGAWKSLTVRLS